MASLKIAHELNPNDDEILADLGLRHAVRMEWDQALPLVELDKVSPGYLSRMESDLAIRHVHSNLVAALRSAIDKVQNYPGKSLETAVRPLGVWPISGSE